MTFIIFAKIRILFKTVGILFNRGKVITYNPGRRMEEGTLKNVSMWEYISAFFVCFFRRVSQILSFQLVGLSCSAELYGYSHILKTLFDGLTFGVVLGASV